MLHRFTKTQFDSLRTSNFFDLDFYPFSIYFKGSKLSRLALCDFCSLLWKKLDSHDLVISGSVKVAPSCSWRSLDVADLNCLCRVLLHDFCILEKIDNPLIVDAYRIIEDVTPFKTFLDYKKDLEIVVPCTVRYTFRGDYYYSFDSLKKAVDSCYPPSLFNINLIF